jgi:hypothetical protein
MGLLRGMARTAVVAGTATAVSNRVTRRQAARWSGDQVEQDAPAQTPSTDDTDTQMAQLERLGQLRDQGIVTADEFETKKKQILGI